MYTLLPTVAAKQIVKRIENCLDEEVRKIKMIYNDFSTGLFDTDKQFQALSDHQKLSEQIKEQSCSIFDLVDQLLYTIENWSSNHNHLRESMGHKKLGNQCIILKRLLNKYHHILEHLSYRGEFGIKNVNLRTKLTKAIEQLNLSSILISEQPYVKNLNMFTIEQEPIFRIKTDEIRFTLINYSDFELDIVNVKLVEENYHNSTFRTSDLFLSDLSMIDNQNLLDFNTNHHNSETTMNKICWVAQNYGSNKKKFKIRVVYLMNNQVKTASSVPIKYRFQILGRFRNQIEENLYTDKFCLIQDTYGQENDSLIKIRQKFRNNHQLDQLDPNRLDETGRYERNYNYDRSTEGFEDLHREKSISSLRSLKNQFDDRLDAENSILSDDRNKENLKIKSDQCIKKIELRFNQRSDKSYKFNEIERSALKERLIHSGNFHLSTDQLLSKEIYFSYSFNTYFKYASFCYFNLVDDSLREKIYGFLNRDKIIKLLSESKEHSYLITFSQTVLSTLVLNYFDDKNQLIELLFFEHNLRNDELNNYLELNKNQLEFAIIKNS